MAIEHASPSLHFDCSDEILCQLVDLLKDHLAHERHPLAWRAANQEWERRQQPTPATPLPIMLSPSVYGELPPAIRELLRGCRREEMEFRAD